MSTGENREASRSARRPRWTHQAWTVLFALVVCAPVDGQQPASRPRPPSNARMAERLRGGSGLAGQVDGASHFATFR